MLRRAAWTLAAVILPVGIAFVSAAAHHASAQVEIRADLEKRIHESQATARAALNIVLEKAEKAALTAASVPGLQSHLQYGSDAPTILDGLQTEDWWREVRDRFPISGLVVVNPRIEAVLGLPTGAALPEALVKTALESHKASGVVVLGSGVWLAGAAEVRAPNAASSGVVVLARPLDQATLEGIARGAGVALLITASGKRIAEAGPAQQDGRLVSLADRATERAVAGPDSTWGAGAEPIAPEVLLWSYAGASPEAVADLIIDRRLESVIWIAGALAAFGFGFVALRWRRKPSPVTTPVPVTPTPSTPAEPVQSGTENTSVRVDQSNAPTRIGPSGTDLGLAPVSTSSDPSRIDSPSRPLILPVPGLKEDRVFGAYYLLDKLATGGMGEVYAAVAFGAEGFKRIFVVKRLRPELSANPELINQFVNEARLGAGLVHSNIIPIFDFGKVGAHYYLAEEYILGRNVELVVSRSLDAQKPLPLELTFFIAHETLKALAYAHSRCDESGAPMGLVHRDISPANIMISSRGEVKLLDFGIAKLPGGPSQTRHGVVKGNMTYMAPEQARGYPVDARTDLFSLGLVIFRCVAGRPLYQAPEMHQLLLKAAEGPRDEEWRRIISLPDPAARLLSKALQPDPAMRFATAEDFAAALPLLSRSSAASLAATVQTLFSEELRREEHQINSAINAATRKVASAG